MRAFVLLTLFLLLLTALNVYVHMSVHTYLWIMPISGIITTHVPRMTENTTTEQFTQNKLLPWCLRAKPIPFPNPDYTRMVTAFFPLEASLRNQTVGNLVRAILWVGRPTNLFWNTQDNILISIRIQIKWLSPVISLSWKLLSPLSDLECT